jgi:hypothetical protein
MFWVDHTCLDGGISEPSERGSDRDNQSGARGWDEMGCSVQCAVGSAIDLDKEEEAP